MTFAKSSFMKPKILATFDKLLLRKRSIIETINDPLKNIFDLEHSRHRSLTNYTINIIASLVAYSYQPKKPSLKTRFCENRKIPRRISNSLVSNPARL